MWALEMRRVRPATTVGPDARIVLGVGVVMAAIASIGVLPREAAAVVAFAGIHGGLIAAALVWSGVALGDALVPVALLALARAAVAAHPFGAVAYVAVPLWLARVATTDTFRRTGLARPWPRGKTAIGALAGAALALHLFVCASRTLGYGLHLVPSIVLPALAYDVGANVISAELFFRGVVLTHLWRRCHFGLALAGATFACAMRYCADPFTASIEIRIGAVVYMTLLALLNGVLYRWSGSLVPGLAAASMFFAGYRLIGRG